MRRSMKRILVLAVSTILLLGTLAGCSAPAGSGAASGTTQAASAANGTKSEATTAAAAADPVTISAMVFDRGNCPEGEGSVTSNRWTKWVNEQMSALNITVTYVPVPRSEEATKIPLMMASNTAADIMLIYNPSLVASFYNNGGTWDIAPYMDAAPQLQAYLGDECLSFGRNEKGEQWAIPARRSTTAQTNVFIRQDWLDKLDMPVPTTVDSLYDTFAAFKEKDPGGVGQENIVCYTGNGLIMNAFLKNAGNDLEYMTAKGFESYGDEGYIDYLKFRNKLYNNGYMDPEYFTSQNFSQKEKELCVSGYLGYWEYDVNGNVDNLRGGLLQNLKKNIPDAEFVSISPVANVNDGKVYNGSYPLNGAFLFLPKSGKNPEACMKYLDFLAGDGGFTIFHGIEGEHYTLVDGMPIVKDAEHNAKTKDWTRHDLFLVGNQGYYKSEADFIKTTSMELPGWEKYVTDNYANAMSGTRLPHIDYTSPTQIEQATNITKINNDYLTKATTCKPEEVDAVYAEWRTELEKYDMQKVLAERRAYFETIYK